MVFSGYEASVNGVTFQSVAIEFFCISGSQMAG
jgi:hypothetical protein